MNSTTPLLPPPTQLLAKSAYIEWHLMITSVTYPRSRFQVSNLSLSKLKIRSVKVTNWSNLFNLLCWNQNLSFLVFIIQRPIQLKENQTCDMKHIWIKVFLLLKNGRVLYEIISFICRNRHLVLLLYCEETSKVSDFFNHSGYAV